MIGPVDWGKGRPHPDLEERHRERTQNADGVLAELEATRVELERVAAASRLAKAHVQLEGLLYAVQSAISHGGRLASLSADAERIARSLDGLAADPGHMAVTVKLALRINALCAEDGSPKQPGTDIET